jgi:hypothetical protein
MDGLPSGLNIYPAPEEKVVAPAIVIRPAINWMQPHAYCDELERWDAMPVVTASSPTDGITELRNMVLAIIRSLVPPWDWETVEGPVIDETTGVPFLACRVRLTYRAGGS